MTYALLPPRQAVARALLMARLVQPVQALDVVLPAGAARKRPVISVQRQVSTTGPDTVLRTSTSVKLARAASEWTLALERVPQRSRARNFFFAFAETIGPAGPHDEPFSETPLADAQTERRQEKIRGGFELLELALLAAATSEAGPGAAFLVTGTVDASGGDAGCRFHVPGPHPLRGADIRTPALVPGVGAAVLRLLGGWTAGLAEFSMTLAAPPLSAHDAAALHRALHRLLAGAAA